MYTKTVPMKDLDGKPRNITLHFNLFEREVFLLLLEFKAIFEWQDRLMKEEGDRTLSDEEVIGFYNNLETILLEAHGVPSADRLHFDKSGKYEFKDSVMFNAIMKLFVEDQVEANKLLDGLMPKDLQEMVRRADESLAEVAKNPETDDRARAEIERLRAQVAELEAGKA